MSELSPEHRAFLAAQAVDPDLAEKLGVRSVVDQEDAADLPAPWPNFIRVPYIAFPWTGPSGRVEWQMRPDEPGLDDRGRPKKYVYRSKKMGYEPVLWAVRPETNPVGVLIVEGTKQCLAAASYAPPGVAVYGIGGCRMWSSEGLPIPDLAVVKGHKVVVVLDADAATNAQVYDAGVKLGQALKKEGAASVAFARITGGDEKDGLDDMLAGLEEPSRAPELVRLVKSAKAKPADRRPTGDSRDDRPDNRVLKVTRASDITPRATRWLWAEAPDVDEFAATGARGAKWLPLSALCLLAGREGVGKSTWAYKLAAEVTRGTLPGAYLGQPKGVVIVATEDTWEVTIVPRLLAAGADLDRVFRVDAEEDGTVSGLMLPTDNARLEEVCRDNEVALVLMDPLMGAIAGELDSHKDHDVRVALEPLSRLAHNARLTIIGLIHVNKSASSDLLTRIMASRAFAAVARAVLFCVAEIPIVGPMGTEAGQDAYYLGQAKNNLGPKVSHSLKYRIEGVKVGHDDELDEAIVSSRVVVEGYTDDRIESISQAQENRKPDRETAVDRAVRWLRDYLTSRGGSAPSAEVKADADAEEHSDRTLKRAKDKLGVLSIDQGQPGGGRTTTWSLPPKSGPTDPTGLSDPTGPTGPTNQNNTNMDERGRSGQSGHRAKPPREVARPGPTPSAPPTAPEPKPVRANTTNGRQPAPVSPPSGPARPSGHRPVAPPPEPAPADDDWFVSSDEI